MTEQLKATHDVFRVGSRVAIAIGRRGRTVLATVTDLPDEDGRPGIVLDGDQTGAERRYPAHHLTPIPQDVDELHTDALREDELRNLIRKQLKVGDRVRTTVVLTTDTHICGCDPAACRDLPAGSLGTVDYVSPPSHPNRPRRPFDGCGVLLDDDPHRLSCWMRADEVELATT